MKAESRTYLRIYVRTYVCMYACMFNDAVSISGYIMTNAWMITEL